MIAQFRAFVKETAPAFPPERRAGGDFTRHFRYQPTRLQPEPLTLGVFLPRTSREALPGTDCEALAPSEGLAKKTPAVSI